MKKIVLLTIIVICATRLVKAEGKKDSTDIMKQQQNIHAKIKDVLNRSSVCVDSIIKTNNSLIKTIKDGLKGKSISADSMLVSYYKTALKNCIEDSMILRNIINTISPPAHNYETDTNNFTFRVYTDAAGINNTNQPNGLIQTEFSTHFNLCPNPIFRIKNKNKTGKVYLFKNVIFPTVNLFQTKSVDSIGYAPIIYNKSNLTRYVNSFNLVKYSNLTISGNLNLIKYKSAGSFSLFVDLYAIFIRTPIKFNKDSLITTSAMQKSALLSIGGGWNIKVQLMPANSRFSANLSYTQFGIALLSDNDVTQSYGRIYYPDNNPKNNTTNKANINIPDNGIGCLTMEIRYSAKKKNKENLAGDGWFFRSSIYTNPIFVTQRNVTNFNYGNIYWMIQLGVSKSIDDLIKQLTPPK